VAIGGLADGDVAHRGELLSKHVQAALRGHSRAVILLAQLSAECERYVQACYDLGIPLGIPKLAIRAT